MHIRKMLGIMKSFHIHMVLKMMDVAVMGFIRGNTMRKNTPPTLQPSTMAAPSVLWVWFAYSPPQGRPSVPSH